MPLLTDISRVRKLLDADRIWSVYALGDLMPQAQPKATWFEPDLTLVYRDFGACILFASGTASLQEALGHVDWPVHLQVRPEGMAVLEQFAVVGERRLMWRMGWLGNRSGWGNCDNARRLTSADVPELERLYSDGQASGEAPDFFFPSMVAEGVFYGAFEGADLVAAAGTHLYAPYENVAAIGNVYTRRDRRGRGLAKSVVGATLAALSSLTTIGLNVRKENAPAIRTYESLGFEKHCEFYEALATRPR